ALPLFYAFHLITKQYLLSNKQRIIAAIVICICLFIYFVTLNSKPLALDWYRFGICFLVTHAVVAFMPHVRHENILGFWQYNKNMAVQFLNATFYTGILFIGLIIAIYAVENLFQFKFSFPSQAYT